MESLSNELSNTGALVLENCNVHCNISLIYYLINLKEKMSINNAWKKKRFQYSTDTHFCAWCVFAVIHCYYLDLFQNHMVQMLARFKWSLLQYFVNFVQSCPDVICFSVTLWIGNFNLYFTYSKFSDIKQIDIEWMSKNIASDKRSLQKKFSKTVIHVPLLLVSCKLSSSAHITWNFLNVDDLCQDYLDYLLLAIFTNKVLKICTYCALHSVT